MGKVSDAHLSEGEKKTLTHKADARGKALVEAARTKEYVCELWNRGVDVSYMPDLTTLNPSTVRAYLRDGYRDGLIYARDERDRRLFREFDAELKEMAHGHR